MVIRKAATTLFLALAMASAMAQSRIDIATQKAKATLAKMTLDEKLRLIDGKGFDLQPIERLGIKRVHMYDGPIGVRGSKPNNAVYPTDVSAAVAERLAPTKSTAYPATVMLAATWNPPLAHEYGYGLGRDCRARGINIILGPGVNIYRSPLNARNFEYMGEDPFLTSRMAVEYIKGVQDNPGVIACVKHFAANNPESGRYDVSSDVDERTMQEIYLPAFKAAIEEGNVGSIMSSYNRIWGTWTSENNWLMHEVLRDQWHFPFISMTDWGAAHHTEEIVKYGVDLEMPGGKAMTERKIKPLLSSGKLTEAMIDEKVLNILRTCYYFNLYDYSEPDLTLPLDNKENAETAYRVAKEGFVLLKNEGVLPIAPSVKRICITGHNALDYVSGGGSSIVIPFRKTSPYEQIGALCKKKGIRLDYKELEENPDVAASCCFADASMKKQGFSAAYYGNKGQQGKPILTRVEKSLHSPWVESPVKNLNPDNNFSARYKTWVRVKESGTYIFSLGGDDGFRMKVDGQTLVDEWRDGKARTVTKQLQLEAGKVYPVEVDYYQGSGSSSVDFKLNWVCPNAKANIRRELSGYDLVLVCEGLDKDLEAEGKDRPFALNKDREFVLEAVAGSGVPAVAIINAGGNIESQQWEPKMKGLIWAWYSGQEGNRALADILFGNVNPSGKLPMTFERKAEDNPSFNTYSDQGGKHVQWTEGVFTGYRGYEKKGVKPLYPFGYGLSYTTFGLTDFGISVAKDTIIASATLTNTGKCDGAEVVQLYVGKDGDSPVLRPAKELKGFRKKSLKPGSSQSFTIKVPVDALRYYDVNTHQWVTDPGKYNVYMGTSVEDIKQKWQIEVPES